MFSNVLVVEEPPLCRLLFDQKCFIKVFFIMLFIVFTLFHVKVLLFLVLHLLIDMLVQTWLMSSINYMEDLTVDARLLAQISF